MKFVHKTDAKLQKIGGRNEDLWKINEKGCVCLRKKGG